MPTFSSSSRSLLAAITALALLDLAAQPVCETLKNDHDEFTGSQVVQITASDYSMGPGFDWYVKDDAICLRLHWQRQGNAPVVVFEGDTLMLKMDTDSVMILTSAETTVGRMTGAELEGSKATFSYSVDPDQLSYISHYWVQKVRIYFRDGHQEFQALNDPSWQMGLWRSSNCLRQTLSLKPLPDVITGYGESRTH